MNCFVLKKLTVHFVSIVIPVMVWGSLYSQTQKITFQSLQEGLSHHHVKCILKDSKGFMWFGTQDGLNKFDGTSIVIYENAPTDSTSLCHNTVNALVEDKYKNIWIGTSNGLNYYDRDNDCFYSLAEFGKRDILYVSSLYYDHRGILWIGTSGNGLFLYDKKNASLRQVEHRPDNPNSLISNFVSGIVADANDNIWVGTHSGLDLVNYDNMTFTHFVNDPENHESLSSNRINALTLDKGGNLWIGTYGGGVDKIVKRNEKYIFQHYQNTDAKGSLSHNNVLSLYADQNRNLWVGTENGGLNLLAYPSDTFVAYYSEDGNTRSLSSNSIWSIYEDGDGIIWIGTFNGGVNIIDRKFERFENIHRNGFDEITLVNNNVRSFAEDEQGNLWIATDGGGISCFNAKDRKFIHKVDNSTLSSKAIMSVICDSKQNVWVGTWAGGINRFNKEGDKIRGYRNEKGFGPGNNIKRMYEDKKGRIWAGTSGRGLFLYNSANDRFEQIQDNNKTSHLTNTCYVDDIFHDSDNVLWIGTLFGLVRMHEINGEYVFKEYLHTSNPKSISSFRITFLFEDSRKNLWIGTEDGLNLFNKESETFTVFLKQDGLPNNSIKGILEDSNGNLWISTNRGISRFNPYNSSFRNFTREDGLNSDEFNLKACIKTHNGEFFFGGNNGVNAFYPDSITINTAIPSVHLTNLLLFNTPVKIGTEGSPLKKNISETGKITLHYNQNSFTIEFVALNYTRSAKNQYAYILEGFEKEWNEVGTRHFASYTNLDPGTYKFKVKASNNDGVWNENPTTLEITVLSPYWKTTTAYLLYILVFSAILFSFIRLLTIKSKQAQTLKLERIHSEKEEELNKLKIQFFTNISHELRTPLSLIMAPLEQIIVKDEVKDDLKHQLKMVFRNVERLLRLINELMDFSKSEESGLKMGVQQDDIVKTVHGVYYLFTDEARRREIDYQFIADFESINAWFDKGRMETVMLNLISNAFKYTPDQGRIFVKVDLTAATENKVFNADTGGFVKISVVDNGSGIAPMYIDKIFDRFFKSPENDGSAQSGTGIGLALVKNLVELHRGSVAVTSEKWKETCFTVQLPLGNSHFQESEIVNGANVNGYSDLRIGSLSNQNLSENQDSLIRQPVILIVEDNIELREYIISILSKYYRTLEAPDGAVGFEIASEYIPDLIISDIIMPKVTGIELCKMIKEDIRTSHIPVALLTSKVAIEEQIEGIETGADVYITKPFNVGYLEVTVKKVIETRRKLFKRFSQEVYILPKEISNNSLDQKFLEQTIEYINKNIRDEEITVENLASHLSMNRSNVYRKIKALTGQTATEFIRTVRLKMAIEYFESGEYNVSEIAFKVGFESPGYFAKCFKKQFGKSPSEFLLVKKNSR